MRKRERGKEREVEKEREEKRKIVREREGVRAKDLEIYSGLWLLIWLIALNTFLMSKISLMQYWDSEISNSNLKKFHYPSIKNIKKYFYD